MSATATADGVESYWNSETLKTKLLIVDDSVMVVFQATGDDDASPGAASYGWLARSVFE